MYLAEFHRRLCEGFAITMGWQLGSALAEDRNSPFIIVLLVISLFLINAGLRRLENSREKLHVYVKRVLEWTEQMAMFATLVMVNSVVIENMFITPSYSIYAIVMVELLLAMPFLLDF
jgi:hypothetical protein